MWQKPLRMLLLLVFISMGISSLASAEYYKYTDEQGIVHFTDNLGNVPPDQRSDENRFKEIKSKEDYSTSPVKQSRRIEESESADHGAQHLFLLQTLNIEKQDLEKKYISLSKKKKALNKEKKLVSTPDEIREFQKKITALNEEIKAFETRRSAFKAKADKYNLGSSQ